MQWLNQNGFGWEEPILDPLDSIEHRDALLTFHDDGSVTETEWPPARFIIGNPPFVGDKRMRRELGETYVDHLTSVFSGRLSGGSDFVCYWFEKSRAQIEVMASSRAGLLATNSIRHGANRETLKRINSSGAIFLAYADEPWILEGAAVRISSIGFDDGSEKDRILDGQSVMAINPDLSSGLDLTVARMLHDNQGFAFIGIQKTGSFDVSDELAQQWLSLPNNANGRSNSDVLRRIVNSRDLVQRFSKRWLIDFPVDMTENEASFYEAPFRYLETNVKPKRAAKRESIAQSKWWLPTRPRPAMRIAMEGLSRYIATPRVAKHRVFVWLQVETLPDSRLVAIASSSDVLFGVLHSRAHEKWSLATASAHGVGNDPTYNAQSCFETYPFPWPPGQEPVDDPVVQRISAAAKELDDMRNAWLNPEGASEAELKKRTFTNLYNANPTWLQNLHAELDRAVWDAYGWPAEETPAEVEEDVVLGRLLALNLERASIPTDAVGSGAG